MKAGSVDVLEIVLVALVADRAEALLQHHVGKAQNGVQGRADLMAHLGQKIGLGGARGLGAFARGDETPLGLALAAQVAGEGAELRRLARADARQRQRQGNGRAVTVAPDDLQRPEGGFGFTAAAQGFEPRGRLGMTLGAKQHQQALARDLVLMIAEQALGGLVQGQDARSRVERDGAVGRPVEHRLKVARRAAARRRRLAIRGPQPRPQLRLERAPERDQGRRRAVPSDHLRVAVDRQDLSVRPHDRDRARILGAHRLRVAVAEHSGEGVRRLKFREIAIADEIEQRAVGVERLPVAGDEDADRQPGEHRAGVALNLDAVGAGLPIPVPLLLAAGVDRAGPFVRMVLARGWSAADEGARDFPECVALAAAEFDALGGEAQRRLASHRLERARADRNDIGRGHRRRMAQDVNLGGALRRRLNLARRGALGLGPAPQRPVSIRVARRLRRVERLRTHPLAWVRDRVRSAPGA